MTKPQWIKAIEHWRSLPQEERRRRHLQAIPRHVANSMAMAEDAVDEDWIREYLCGRPAGLKRGRTVNYYRNCCGRDIVNLHLERANVAQKSRGNL